MRVSILLIQKNIILCVILLYYIMKSTIKYYYSFLSKYFVIYLKIN